MATTGPWGQKQMSLTHSVATAVAVLVRSITIDAYVTVREKQGHMQRGCVFQICLRKLPLNALNDHTRN